MGRYIIQIKDDANKKDYFLEWSTIVEAPVTYGLSLEEFKEYYRHEYGESGMRELPALLEMVKQSGTSLYPPYDNLDDTLKTYDLNRDKVGDQKEYILENFCRNRRL